MDNKKVRRRGIIGLVIIFVFGILITFGISYYIKGKVVDVIGNLTADFIQNTVLNKIDPIKLLSENKKDEEEVSVFLEEVSKAKKVKLIKVWNTKGLIVHSNVKSIEGSKYPISSEVQSSLQGKVVYELSNLDKIDNGYEKKKYNQLYAVYIPIKGVSNRVTGVFEILWDSDEIYNNFTKIYYTILIVLTLSFVLTYLGMYQVMKKLVKIINIKEESLDAMAVRLNNTSLAQQKAYMGTIQSLLAALDARDNYSAGHSIRLADYAIKIARRLNLPDHQIKLIEESALIHDLGMIAVPEDILNKHGVYDKDEYDVIKQHPIVGEQIVRASGIFDNVATIVRCHHERIDGSGYPDAIRGDQIPIEAQLIAVVDFYDALTNNRPYRDAMSFDDAIQVLLTARGSQLNAQIVDTFIEILRQDKNNIE